jgi:asparagine synthase (glutamine-hydrolysing)
MLTAEIHFSDLRAPVEIIDGSVVLGGSRVTPFAHRLLRALVIETGATLAIICLERFRSDPHGIEHLRPDNEREAAGRLNAVRSHLLDWAILTIDRAGGAISYEASQVHTAPVYLRSHAGRVAIDWDCTRLLRGAEAPIDWPATMAQLAGMVSYTSRTMVAGLYRSVAGATLTVRGDTIETHLPPPAAMPGAQSLFEQASAEDLLFDTVKALIAARDIDPRRTAIELSGGMDSALVALAAADLLGSGVLSYGAQFDGAMGDAQRGRRELLCRHGGFEDVVLPANRFPPFGPHSARRDRFGVWPQDESYPEIFESFFDLLARAGIDTLTSGFGGDELYAVYSGEEPAGDGEDRLDAHPFLTARGRDLARQGDAPGPQGLLADTSWLSAAGRSQRLLRQGIWPVHPYINPILARFIASLPWEYRRDRMLLRRTLTARLGDPVFEQDYVKESFREVAVRGITENRDYLRAMLSRSPVLNPELVDRDRVLAALDGDIAALPSEAFGLLFLVLTTCCFFDG